MIGRIKYILLYKAANGPEAYLLKGIMENNNIETIINGEHLTSALGELPVEVGQLKVLINSNKLPKALELLEIFKESNKSSEERLKECQECGSKVPSNFDFCWKCESII